MISRMAEPASQASNLHHRVTAGWVWFTQGRLGILPYPVLFVIGYFLLQALLLSLTRNGASFDGAEQLVTSQSLEWGYGRSQPPLYTWLLFGLEGLVRAPLVAEHLLKAALFIIGFSAIYVTARQIGFSKSAAAVAMFATFLLPEIGWQAQTAYTHSTLVFATGSMLLYSFSRLSPQSGTAQMALFGLLAGLALLSKFSAAYLIVAMLAVLWWQGELLAILARKQALAALACLVLLVAPHLVWSFLHPDLLFALKGRFELEAYSNPLVARAVGLLNYLVSVAIFIAPVALASGLAAGWPWRFLRPMMDGEKRLHAVLFCGLGIMALTPILSGASDFAPRWPLAAIFFYGIIATSFVDRIRPQRLAAFGMIAVLIAVVFMCVMSIRSSLPESRFENDYNALLSRIEQKAGPVRSVVIADYPVLANLRLARPDLRLVMDEFPFTQRYLGPQSVYLWISDGGMPERLKALARKAGRDPDNLVWVEIPVIDSYGNETSTVVRAAF